MLLQSVNSCSNEQVIDYCSIFFKPFNSPIDMQSWTKLSRQFRETNALQQTQNFVLEWKHLFHRWSPNLPETMLKNEGRGFNSHPGQSFFLSLCGPNSNTRVDTWWNNWVWKLHSLSLRPHSNLESSLSIYYWRTTGFLLCPEGVSV